MVDFLFFSDLVVDWSIYLLHSLSWPFSEMTIFEQGWCNYKWQEHQSRNMKMYKRVFWCPSALVMIMGFPPFMDVAAEFLVPKLVPITFLQRNLTGPIANPLYCYRFFLYRVVNLPLKIGYIPKQGTILIPMTRFLRIFDVSMWYANCIKSRKNS